MFTLPKGNALMTEDVTMSADDVQTMVDNLQTDAFTGYVRLNMGDCSGYAFYTQGSPTRAFEQMTNGDTRVRSFQRLFGGARNQAQVRVSSYILSSKLVSILASAFAYKSLYKDYQVKRKELKKVLTNLEHDEFSGVLQCETPDGRVSVLLDKGEPVHDQFAHHYGQILCGREAITNLFEYVHSNGSTIQVYAEKAKEIENQKKKIDAQIERLQPLVVKQTSGVFANKETATIDEEIVVKEWGIDPKATFWVLLERADGHSEQVKARSGRKKGNSIEIHQALIKTLQLRDGEEVQAGPVTD
jgi:hypothetical protein